MNNTLLERLVSTIKSMAALEVAPENLDVLLEEAEVEITKQAAVKSTVALNAMSGKERVQSFLDVVEGMPHIIPLNILDFANGQAVATERGNKFKLPLQFPLRDLMDDADIRKFNLLDKAHMYLSLVAIDLKPFKNVTLPKPGLKLGEKIEKKEG